jgi:hypothetical protein
MTSLTYVNECFHDFMFVNRAPPRFGKFSSTARWKALQSSSTIRTIRRLFPDYSYYSSTIRGLFVVFVDYSRTIRGLFVDYSHYSHYSLHYSSFINCPLAPRFAPSARGQVMDHSPINHSFDLNKSRQNSIIAWKSITKLVIFQSFEFVAKCCKMRII